MPLRPRPYELLPPRLSLTPSFGTFEYSAHTLTASLLRDVVPVFPLAPPPPLVVVPTLQRSSVALTAYGAAEAAEKDRLQGVFFAWAAAMRDALAATGHWGDGTDPATGAALFGDEAALYSDVPAIARLLRYPTLDAGGCTILLHPEWGTAVYPATFFTNAPLEVVREALAGVNEDRDLVEG